MMYGKQMSVANAKASLLQKKKKSTCLHGVYLKLYTFLPNYGLPSQINHNIKVF